REIQKNLKELGVSIVTEADETTTGPASMILSDPDGNVILVDQHR
ncbi:MAG: VOC family protein, partial [Chloroflexota bacterium]